MKKAISIIILFLITALSFSAISEEDSKKAASETLNCLKEINEALSIFKKKKDITTENKTKLIKAVNKLKALKIKITAMKRTASAEEIKKLNKEFNTGIYAVALKIEVKKLFSHIKRVRKIEGGAVIANLVTL